MARRGDGIYLRGRTWRLDFRHDGRRYIVRLGRNINRTAAQDIASVKRAAILKGEVGIGRKRKDITLEKAAEVFLAWVKINKRLNTAKDYEKCLDMVKKAFPGKRLSELHAFALEGYKRRRAEEGAKVRVNRELARLKTLFNKMIEWGKYAGENPVRKVKFLTENPGRLRWLEPEEEAKLLEACNATVRPIVLTALHTGCRLGELVTLRWEDVDFRTGLLTVQAAYAKTGETRSIPMNPVLTEALRQLKLDANGQPHVFLSQKGGRYHSVRTAFESALRRAGIAEFTFHDLRHTFASRLVMAGVDLTTVKELLGHKDIKMTLRYAHLSQDHKRQAVNRLADNSRHYSHQGEAGTIQEAENVRRINPLAV